MRNKPRIRFKGFTEDWEQRKLGQFTARVTRKNGGQSDLPLTISAQDGLVDQRKYFNRQVASRDMSNYYLIKKGEFAYNKSYSEGYPFGAVKRLDYYNIGALSTLYILFEITDKNISSDFIVSYYMTHLWYKEISKRAAEGARNHGLLNISTEDFFDSELNIPNSIEEQVKIGNFIKEFDKFITLHQRKLEKLKLAKKALLQKLFPKNGSQFPEIRFKGFTDAWEQRKLGDIATFSKGNGYSKSDLASSGNPIILYGRLYTNYETTISNVDTFVELKDKSVISQGGEVIVPASGETAEDISRASVVKKQGIIIGGDLNVIKANHLLDPTFLALTISNGEQQKELSKRAQGKSVVHLHNSDLQEVNLTFPLLNEQKEISTLFEKMDNIITLHQRKLDKLQEMKKGLLQKMFV